MHVIVVQLTRHRCFDNIWNSRLFYYYVVNYIFLETTINNIPRHRAFSTLNRYSILINPKFTINLDSRYNKTLKKERDLPSKRKRTKRPEIMPTQV